MFIDHNFNPSKYPWTHMLPTFEDDPHGGTHIGVEGGDQAHPPTKDTSNNLRNWLSSNQARIEANPDWTAKVIDATCTSFNRKAGYAAVQMESVISGVPAGVARPALTQLEFKLVDGKWMAARSTVYRGWIER